MPSLSLLGAHLQGKENALATDKAFENYESQMKKTNISKFYWRFAIESVLAMVRTKRSYRRIGGNWGKLLELIDNDRARKRYAAATEKERKDLLLTKALNIVRQKEPSERTEEDIEVLFAAFPSLKRHSHDIHMASLLASELKLRKASQGEIIYDRGALGKEFFVLFTGKIRLWINGHSSMHNHGSAATGESETLDEMVARHSYQALSIGTLVPGDIFSRNARSVHYFEVCAYAVADGNCDFACVPSHKYDEIVMRSRVKANDKLQKEVLSRRRRSLLMGPGNSVAQKAAKRGAVKGLFKKALGKAKIKKEKIQGKMSALSVVKSISNQKERVRLTMGKLPEDRKVDDLEFVTEYLSKLHFWEKFDNLEDDVAMTPNAKREVVKHLSLTTYWKKEILFEEGDVGDYFYFVLSGSVLVRKKHGLTSTSLCILNQGQSFGELALSSDSNDGRRTATVVAREISEFLVLHKDLYLQNLSKYQESHLRQRVGLVQKSTVFRSLPWDTKLLQSVCYPMERSAHTLDTVLCKQGGRASCCFMIERGEANVFKNVRVDGSRGSDVPYKSVPLGRLGPGDFFGLKAASGDVYGTHAIYNATVVSTSPIIVHSLTRYDIFNRLLPDAKAQFKRWSNSYDDDVLLARQLKNYDHLKLAKELCKKEIFPLKYRDRVERVQKDVVEKSREKTLRKKRLRSQPKDVPHNAVGGRRYSVTAHKLSMKATPLKETSAYYERTSLKSLSNAMSAPDLGTSGGDQYDMWTLPNPLKAGKKPSAKKRRTPSKYAIHTRSQDTLSGVKF